MAHARSDRLLSTNRYLLTAVQPESNALRIPAHRKLPESRLFSPWIAGLTTQRPHPGHGRVQISNAEKHKDARIWIIAMQTRLHGRRVKPTLPAISHGMEFPLEKVTEKRSGMAALASTDLDIRNLCIHSGYYP